MHRRWPIALAALLVSCSGAPPPDSVAGTWIGSFKQSNGPTEGTVTLVVADNGGAITGTISVSTLGNGLIDGTYAKGTGRWSGNLETGIGTGYGFAAAYDLTVSGTTGTGKFTMLGGGTGDFTIRRPK